MKTLEEVAGQGRAFAMGPFGSNIKTENFVESGVPVIQGRNLNGTRLDEENFVFVTDEKADELSASLVTSGDIAITHRGTLGQVVMIPRASRYPRYVISQSQMKVTVDEARMSPEFVTYWLQSSLGQAELLAYASQTGVPAIAQPLASLRKVKVICPPLYEQRAIAGVLGALDDKIESNRRLSRTGVQLARTMLLQGDTRVRLGDVASCEKGLSYKGEGLVEGSDSGLPMINLGNFTTTGWLVPDKLKFYRGDYKERHLVLQGDVVVANTDLTQQRVIIGRPALVPPRLERRFSRIT